MPHLNHKDIRSIRNTFGVSDSRFRDTFRLDLRVASLLLPSAPIA